MPWSRLPFVPGGFGMGWSAQVLPFQCSARGGDILGLLVPYPPTAVHQAGDTQDTPARTPPVKPAGLAARRTVQAPPVHCSASRCLLPCTWLLENPTAVQSVAVGQATAVVMPNIAPGGRGVGWRTQPVAAPAATGQLSMSTAAVMKPIRFLRITPPSSAGGDRWAAGPTIGCRCRARR